jgi:DNA-binding NtrC family response regulator
MFRADLARPARNKTFEEYPMSISLMIVDDSAAMRKIVMRTVCMAGLTFDKVEEAGNGVEARTKLSAGAVDVIFCGVNMPEMGRLELVGQAITNGSNGHITKPFTPEQFQGKFSQCMN